jgi:hypothetical protein
MRNAARILIFALSATALTACGKSRPPTENEAMSIDSDVANGQLPANAEIETLPPDESSEVTSGELNAGDDNPDVNDLGNNH